MLQVGTKLARQRRLATARLGYRTQGFTYTELISNSSQTGPTSPPYNSPSHNEVVFTWYQGRICPTILPELLKPSRTFTSLVWPYFVETYAKMLIAVFLQLFSIRCCPEKVFLEVFDVSLWFRKVREDVRIHFHLVWSNSDRMGPSDGQQITKISD